MAAQPYFTVATFEFLTDLASNNDRTWFQKNKRRYEDHIKAPALRFISDFVGPLEKISEHFRADARPVGGSLFRIHRDTRFSNDKSPYKTQTGIHFRHEASKDAHAPGFYLHIAPDEVFLGGGIWHPDGPTLGRIREAIADDPQAWRKAVGGKAFKGRFELEGDSLSRPPRGFDADHPVIGDLKRKDFIGVARLDQDFVTSPDLLGETATLCRACAPLNRFLCEALDLPY
jgi:uncharacterized protein (TIGR02453 family)